MKVSLVARALHDRTRLAFSAAVAAGLPGSFIVSHENWLFSALASELGFLNSVSATIPEARGTGVQSALLRHRLAVATKEGYTSAVATAGPDTPSARNLARGGLVILARQRWEHPPNPRSSVGK